MKKLFLLTLAFVASLTAMAQTNLTSGKTVVPLGGLKTYTNGNDATQTYTISNDDLQKITVDGNTDNVYLFPETGGGWATDANKAIGIQGFYIDLGSSKSIGSIKSTWEGADAGGNIYVTDTEPAADGSLTGATLIATFTNAQEGKKDVAAQVSNSGRYVVFVPTDATNWGWGVKIRTFAAFEKAPSVLTTLLVTPSVVHVGEPTEMTFTPQDQDGMTLTGVTYTVTNATLSGTTLTATAAGDVVITATLNGVSIQKIISAISVSAPTANPTEPTDLAANVIAVYSAKYGKGITDSNSGWGVGGGAPNPLYSSLEEVEIADGHKVVHVKGTGFNSRPARELTNDDAAYDKIHVALYPFTTTTAKIFFDNAYANAITVTDLTPGQWNYVVVDNSLAKGNYYLVELVNETEFYLDHFYFAKPAVDDAQAPTLDVAELVSAGIGSATLKLKATDDKSTQVTYVITDQNSKTYTTKGNSGAEITYTIGGLEYGADYTFTITAKDDNENVSDSKTVTATTLAMVAAPVPDKAAANVVSLYSDSYTAATTWAPGGWGQATVQTEESVGDNKVLKFTSFNYFGFDSFSDQLDLSDMEYVHIDVLPLQDMNLRITPILVGSSENATSVGTLTPGVWNSKDIKLSDLGLDYANKAYQLKLDNGTGTEILYVDNIYFWKEATEPTTKTIYLNPNIWSVDNPNYAAYVYGEGNVEEWIAMTPLEDTDYYKATIPVNYTGLIFVRLNPAAEMNWDGKWNQTVDIDFTQVADNTLFTITGWGEDENPKSTVTTSTYVAPTTYTATFKNSIGWDEVYAYAWTEGEPVKEYLGAWPGTKLTDVEGTLTISFKATEAPANIIFNNGETGDGKQQTENLVFEDGKEYDMVAPVEHNGTEYTVNDHTIWVQAINYVATNTYEVIITSEEEMTGLGGSFWELSTGNADLREHIEVSADKHTITITATSTSDPRLYTPLYILTPGEVSFSDVVFDWIRIDAEGNIVVPATISNYQWATFSSDKALDFTNVSDVKAYIVTGAEGSTLTTRQVEGAVAANTGLVLFSETADTYYIPVAEEGTSYASTNKLVAVTEDTEVGKANDGTNYVLTVQGDKVVFAYIDDISAQLKKGQSYLHLDIVEGETPAPFLGFDGTGTTGINSVERGALSVEGCYTLDGRRVAQPTKGLYIVNGKKVLVK